MKFGIIQLAGLVQHKKFHRFLKDQNSFKKPHLVCDMGMLSYLIMHIIYITQFMPIDAGILYTV